MAEELVLMVPGQRWKSEKGGLLDCDSCLKLS